MMRQHPLKFFDRQHLKAREQQLQVIERVHQSWDKYRYFALSLPTGVGKTYIACGIADSVKNAYMLTSSLQLQTQYEESWKELVNLKGRGNYTCQVNTAFTVDAAPCSASQALFKDCRAHSRCDYYNQKDAALEAKAMITNPLYLLYSAHCGFAKDSEENVWIQREALIVDEAHNMESHLVQFAESDIDPLYLHDSFGVAIVTFQGAGHEAEDYLKVCQLLQALHAKSQELRDKLDREFPQAALVGIDPQVWAKGFTGKVADKVKRLNNKIYQLDKVIQPLKIFFNTHSADNLTERWLLHKYPDRNVLKLSPIYGNFLFKEYFEGLAQKFVFLSATLGSKEQFCKELGIPEAECLFIETDSPFDPAKSPIISLPVIKLSKDHFDKNIAKLGPILDDILDQHVGERGIIHSVTYELQKQIYQRVAPRHRKRLLCRDMDLLAQAELGVAPYGEPKKYKNDELLDLHELQGGAYGSVLLSPSMMEGVDLKGDLSLFQVIIKLPWANLGDARVAKKAKLDAGWYANKMWLNVLQASGRSTRTEGDTATTYLLDQNTLYFYGQWKHQLPAWFKRRLVI